MEPLVQLEDESEKLLDEIIFEDNIVLSTEGLPNPIPSIGKWMEAKSMTLWTKVFSSHIGKGGSYSKSQEFMAQEDCSKSVKRAVMRYFWRVLVRMEPWPQQICPSVSRSGLTPLPSTVLLQMLRSADSLITILYNAVVRGDERVGSHPWRRG